MRYKHLLSEQQLDELRMSPGSLRQFSQSKEAQGIQAGFEAELVFRGLGGSDGEQEPNYDADERAYSIDDIIQFFSNDDDGFGLSDREERQLYNQLDEEWMEYFDEQMYEEWHGQALELTRDVIRDTDWDEEDEIHEYLSVEHPDADADYVIAVGTRGITNTDGSEEENQKYTNAIQLYKEASAAIEEALDERAEESLANQDRYYDEALDSFRDDFNGADQEDWLRENYRYMSDVSNAFNLTWPIWTSNREEGGFSEESAEGLARELQSVTGMEVRASGGYHSASRKPNLWIIEPDSSLDADDEDDMPAEIVSPPMPLAKCLEMMDKFFSWAESNGAYANQTTGFHMGVSLPTTGGKVDYIKLALFLGDEHVLREFGRQANHFTEAAMKKIRNKVGNNPSQISSALDLMRNGLIELATKTMSSIAGSEKNPGFGKYTSINPKGNYIEFRSAGGTNYFEDIAKLKNTLLRYAQAMTVAANPSAERQEYYKKLYKLISPPEGNAAMDLFARFASGNISSDDLKKQWANATLEKEAPSTLQRSNWKVYNKRGQPVEGLEFNGMTEQEAMAAAKNRMSPGSTMFGFKKSFDENFELRNVSASTGKWAIIDRNTGETLEVVDSENRGDAADLAMQKYAGKGIDYYIEPVPSDTPKPKLSRRAELAKRIKDVKGPTRWQMVNDTTGERSEPFDAPDLGHARQQAMNMARATQYNGGYTIEPAIEPVAEPQQQATNTETNVTGNWEIVDPTTGEVVRRLNGTTFTGASHVADTESQLQHRNNTNQFVVRRAQQQATSTGVDQGIGPGRNPAEQAHAANGLPMWEIYQRSNDLPLHRFADHTQMTAWSTAGEWARNNGFHPQDLSMRPATTTDPVGTQAAQQPAEQTPNYEIYKERTGQVIHRFYAPNAGDAQMAAERWMAQNGMELRSGVIDMRPIVQPTAESLAITKNMLGEFDSWLGTMKLPKRLS